MDISHPSHPPCAPALTVRPNPLEIALPWLTLGAVAVISLLVQPVKFMTPGLALVQLIAVGSTVFHASHVFQWLALASMAWVVPRGRQSPRHAAMLLLVVGLALLAQTMWLMPELDARLDALRAGRQLPASPLHTIYIGVELIKLAALYALARQPLRVTHLLNDPTSPGACA